MFLMPVYRLPGCVCGRSQTIARQHALVQALEFFDDERLHAGLLMLWHMARYSALDADEWIIFGMDDDLADGLLDQVTPGQAQGAGSARFCFRARYSCVERSYAQTYRSRSSSTRVSSYTPRVARP